MKLKAAVKIAKEKGFGWVSVDKDRSIFFYRRKPIAVYNFFMWKVSAFGSGYEVLDKKYTGRKSWEKTLRKVK